MKVPNWVLGWAVAAGGLYLVYLLFIAPVEIKRKGIKEQGRMQERFYTTDNGMQCLILGHGQSRGITCDWGNRP